MEKRSKAPERGTQAKMAKLRHYYDNNAKLTQKCCLCLTHPTHPAHPAHPSPHPSGGKGPRFHAMPIGTIETISQRIRKLVYGRADGMPNSLESMVDYLPATMGRRTLSQEDRYTLAQKRGYSAQSTSDRQTLLSQTEQQSLAGATKDKHKSVEMLWKEFLTVKGLEIEAILRDSAIFKDFIEYYALEVIQRFVKGRCDDENDNIYIVIKSTDHYNITGYETLGDLMRARLPKNRDSWELEWKDEAKQD
ncbi:hypothetical protein V491_04316 [Pseudogymnoascus sp. VKM F-3775]|nr:hypothetical protein V491_04316 [Pseudogymnoascus sp. VKM F-3775]